MPSLPFPPFFRPEHAADWSYQPQLAELREQATAWRTLHGITPAHQDDRRAHLLLIDLQRDFCLPQGSLFVAGREGNGAIADNERLTRFIYRNLARISQITCTLDTHTPHQIFSPDFWVDGDGSPLAPDREIHADEVRSGAVAPTPGVASLLGVSDEWLLRELIHYCESLEAGGRYQLYLWPHHCLIGGDGHGLVGVVQEARLFHALVRRARSCTLSKGDHPLTEHYSVFSPEVPERHAPAPPGSVAAQPPPAADALVDELLNADKVLIAGQAASHCVKSSVDDLVDEASRRGERTTAKIHVLEDCMSSVVVRGSETGEILFDFTEQAVEAMSRWRDRGVQIIKSTDELEV